MKQKNNTTQIKNNTKKHTKQNKKQTNKTKQNKTQNRYIRRREQYVFQAPGKLNIYIYIFFMNKIIQSKQMAKKQTKNTKQHKNKTLKKKVVCHMKVKMIFF